MGEDNYSKIINEEESKSIDYLILSCTYHNSKGNIRKYNNSNIGEYPIVGIAIGKKRRGEYLGLNVIAVDKKILKNKKNCFECNYLKIEPIGTNNGKINRNKKIKLNSNYKVLTQEELREIKEKLYEGI